MAHTFLFDKLRSAIKTAVYLNQNKNISTDELISNRKSGEFSRRTFLKTSAIATGGLLLPASQVFAKTKIAPRVVVVGAGISGLNAAYKLKKSGINAQVFEASKRTGGRILTIKNLLGEGLTTEFGAEFIDSNHSDMHSLVKELGLGLVDVRIPSEDKYVDIFYFNGKNYYEKDIVEAALPFMNQLKKDFNAYYQGNIEFMKKLDSMSLSDYLKKVGITGWLYELIDSAFVIDFGGDLDKLSAMDFIDFAGIDSKKNEFKMYGESDERFKVIGGNQRLVDELAHRVKEHIKTEHILEAISANGNGYKLTFQKPNHSVIDVQADYLILTIPISMLREVKFNVEMTPLKKKAIKEIYMGKNTKFVAGFKSRLWREQGSNGNIYTDESCQCGWDNSRLQNGETGGYTFFLGGSKSEFAVKTLAQTKKYINQLSKIYPGVNADFNGKHGYTSWNENPFMKGSFSCYLKGQRYEMAEELRKPVGNIFFAGEQTSAVFNAFMNGGAETGRLGAEFVMARVKK